MTLISDEIVEKAARAIYEARWPATLRGDSKHGPEDTRNARAALLAILPDIVEEIAKVAEDLEGAIGDNGAPEIPSHYDAAARIRQLSTNTKGDSNGR